MSGKTIASSPTRIEALNIQSSTYGATIPWLRGVQRIPGNLVWYGGFKSIPKTQKTGGKGGGGSSTTTYSYTASLIMGLCHGQISSIPKVWKGKGVTTPSALGLSVLTGALGQPAWSGLSGFGGQSIGYSGLAAVAGANYNLGSSASVENHSFEVVHSSAYAISGSIPDVDPSVAMADLLTDTSEGAGLAGSVLATWTDWSNWCVASGLLVSPLLTEQAQAIDVLRTAAELTNTGMVWSDGKLKMVPYADQSVTGNGRTFSPSNTPVYQLDDTCYTPASGQEPLRVSMKTPSDLYNHVRVEYKDRSNGYQVAIAEAKDLTDISVNGLRSMPTISAHWVTTAAVARQVAQLRKQRALLITNTYAFELPWHYALIEPMDLITLSDAALGMVNVPVRVTEVSESDDGTLSITAEDFPAGSANAPLYAAQVPTGFAGNQYASPGSVSQVVVFEGPGALTGKQLQVWVAARGDGPDWGGCSVWVSLDGTTYTGLGRIEGGSRCGQLTAAVSGGTLPVQIGAAQQLVSVSATDAAALNSLCYVGPGVGAPTPELLAYTTATLTGAGAYTLGSLVRAAYGTSSTTHASGAPFAFIDQSIAKSGAIDPSYIGATISIKCTSFNIFGLAEESLASVSATAYTVTGAVLGSTAAGVSLSLSTDALALPADNAGNVSSYAQASTAATVLLSGVDDTANWAFAGAAGAGLTFGRTGAVFAITSLAAGTDTATLTITATKSGQPTLTKILYVSKAKGGAAGSTGPQGLQGVPGISTALGRPLDTWTLNGQSLVTLSDGIVGTTALRLSGLAGAYPNQGNYTAIDATRTYRVRFWARPSVNTAGLLYFSMRQFADSIGTPGPANGGRSPYKPGAVSRAAHIAQYGGTWGQYVFDWTAADWQSGAKFVQPEFLDNYTGAAGYWDIQGFEFFDATEALAAQTTATTAAGNASAALSTLATMRSNGYLDAAEKPALIREWLAIAGERPGIVAQANALGITAERDAYTSAHDALNTYLSGLSPAYNNTATDTPITPATDQATWTALYTARQALLNKIADIASQRATWGSVSGAGKPLDDAGKTVDAGIGSTTFGQRQRNDLPAEYPWGRSLQFKDAAAIGLSAANGPYCTLETIIQYNDDSGGPNLQYAYQGDKTWRRSALRTAAAWGAWTQDLDRNAYTGDLNATHGAPAGTLVGGTLAQTVESNAANALANAATAQSAANAANTALANIASDAVLSPGEKPTVVRDYAVIAAEQVGIDAQAVAFGIAAEKTAYDNAVSALTSYLGGLTGWDTIPGSDVAIVGSTFRANFAAVYTARQALLNKIAAVAGTTAAWGGVSGIPANVTSALNRTGDTISGRITLAVADGIFAGTDTNNGVYFGSGGLVGRKAGVTTFGIDTAGNAVFGGTLVAASGSFGSVTAANTITLGPTGAIVAGTRTSYNSGSGFMVAPYAGNWYFGIGNDTTDMQWDGLAGQLRIRGAIITNGSISGGTITGGTITNPTLTLGTFATSTPADTYASGANGTATYATLTTTPSGGLPPYTYSWAILSQGVIATGTTGVIPASMRLSGASSATVTVLGSGKNSEVLGQVQCSVTDANGRTANTGVINIDFTHGTLA